MPQEDPQREDLIKKILGGLGYIEWLQNQPKYLNIRGRRPVFWLPDEPCPVLFLVEGPVDAIVLNQWGFPSAAIGGSGLSSSQQARLVDFPFLPILRDAGDNGREFAEGWAERLGSERAPIIDPPPGFKDAGELAQHPDGEAITESLLRPYMNGHTSAHPPGPVGTTITAELPVTDRTQTVPASADSDAYAVGKRITGIPLAVCPKCGCLVYPGTTLNCCDYQLGDGDKVRCIWIDGEIYGSELYEFDPSYLPQSEEAIPSA
ncbi:MAG: hypothetical protein KGJ86_15855 [Chloroflexota bacterium]|nr:hypothetical protein [Chloroflexota bacterium]